MEAESTKLSSPRQIFNAARESVPRRCFISRRRCAKLLRVSVEVCTLAGGLPAQSVSPSVVLRVASEVDVCRTAEFGVQPGHRDRYECIRCGKCGAPIDSQRITASHYA